MVESEDVERLAVIETTQPSGMGTYRYARLPYSISGAPRRPSRGAPVLGEHSRTVLSTLGYDPSRIDELVSLGVVGDGSDGPAPTAVVGKER